MLASVGTPLMHNAELPEDVNLDGVVSANDALVVVNHLTREHAAGENLAGENSAGEQVDPSSVNAVDVNDDQLVSAVDALMVINHMAAESESPGLVPPPAIDFDAFAKAADVDSDGTMDASDKFFASFNKNEAKVITTDPLPHVFAEDDGDSNLIEEDEVETLLRRASQATSSNDAIIAVVDRAGTILGVRVEDGVSSKLTGDKDKLAFAIDGAVAKARTAAFFSSNGAPLTSRTIRFISQSTITQREVESAPLNDDPRYKGPGLVAPIGVGGHFPPEIAFAPQVDLFAIEHQSRDSQLHPGKDAMKGTHDDFFLNTRFNADPKFIPENAEGFFTTWPESYGEQSGTSRESISRGIATLPGGIPLYKKVPQRQRVSESINLVGGIGVFFPGEDGFANHEQGFKHASENGGQVQSEKQRTNAEKVLEAEAAAIIAASGSGLVGPNAFLRDLREFNNSLPALSEYVLPIGRIDLVGITLEIYGPTPDRSFRQPGIDRVIHEARRVGMGSDSGTNHKVRGDGTLFLKGKPVAEQWLVAPHDSKQPGGLKAEDVKAIIDRGIETAERTRAAIRLDIDNDFRPGTQTRMVFAVADTDGELLGLYRMPDATIFSIDVSIAKARNTAYYADANDLVAADRVDFDGDGVSSGVGTSIDDPTGDTFPLGTALTNRSFRFLVEPRFPTGSELNPDGSGTGPQSGLRLPGINPFTAENTDNDFPLEFSVYASADHRSTVMFDSFNVSRNFRDPGDGGVKIAGSNDTHPLANQNGVVFFPGSTPLYVDAQKKLAGGFGVSGDGVDQDDVVTFGGQVGYEPLQSIRVDTYTIGGVRVPFQKFNRNPFGD